MKTRNHSLRILVATFSVLALLAADATAQRRGRRGRRPQSAPQQEAPAPKPAEEDKKVESWTVIRGADIYVGNGSVLRRASVLIGDDKIHGVGHELEIPEGATEIDARGKVVSPGFCIVKGAGMGAPANPQGSYADEVNPFDPSIKLGLAAGITSFLTQSDPGNFAPKGKSAVVKLAFGDLDGMVLKENTAVSMRVPINAQQLRNLRKQIREVREFQEKQKAETGTDKPAKPPRGTEKLVEVLDGKARLWITSRGPWSERALRQALEIGQLLEVGVVLDNPAIAWAYADEVSAAEALVVMNPRERIEPDPARPNRTGSNIAQAAILAEVGVPLAVTPPGGRFGGARPGTGGILGQDLNTPHVDAAYAVRGGMDNRQALRTLTLDAARIMGVADRIGSIEEGKDADILILDGDPLHYKTFVDVAIVNGKVVYEKDKEPFYNHIKR